jgi:NADPH-dependent 2,4-dienoyl-CoA reductase/sulfur reductase-like enzyme
MEKETGPRPEHAKYLILGGGMTGDAAVHGIREVDPNGSIAVIGAEPHAAYDRPPLSKGLWKGKPLDSIWRKDDVPGVTYHRGRRGVRIDAKRKRVTDDRGTEHPFDKLLIATGATPRRLQPDAGGMIYFRTLDDYRILRAAAGEGKRFAVLGGGFIGSEIAAALSMAGCRVTLLFPGKAIGGRIFPQDLGESLNQVYRDKGVQVVPRASFAVEADPGKAGGPASRFTVRARTGDGGGDQAIEVDGVVAGIGVLPNVVPAQDAGLTIEDGIRVDASLRTSHPDIFAAGDVASLRHPVLGHPVRVEHEDNANTMGRLAGRSMAGEKVVFDHLSMFYSDLFELGYEAVGDLDPRLETIADWKEPFRQGVVYYLKDGRVRGVLLWNVWEQVDAARALILEPGPFRAADLKGRIPTQ